MGRTPPQTEGQTIPVFPLPCKITNRGSASSQVQMTGLQSHRNHRRPFTGTVQQHKGASILGVVKRVHQIQDMVTQVAIGSMRPSRLQGASHVCNADAAGVLFIGVRQWNLCPVCTGPPKVFGFGTDNEPSVP
jgi:hypothetical protein